ncbi:MAG: formyltetrahydrofolate deformylase [Gammaproteobacteria bacterium]
MQDDFILKLRAPDRSGIVAAVSGLIADLNGWITESDQHADEATGQFLVRIQIKRDSLSVDKAGFEAAFQPIAERFSLDWCLVDGAKPKNVVILVSKHDHCLAELLYRWRNQDFDFHIPCVISNHPDLRDYVEWHGIPYHHVPVNADNKEQAYAEVERLFEQYQGDVMVLARYMQILSEEMCRNYSGRIINIHHSFLPSFVGARPYRQAFERGVKLIGATCHYVTADLDAGPIIEQDVARVDHRHDEDDMVRLGRDVEKMVLVRGLQAHVEERAIIVENRTVVMS